MNVKNNMFNKDRRGIVSPTILKVPDDCHQYVQKIWSMKTPKQEEGRAGRLWKCKVSAVTGQYRFIGQVTPQKDGREITQAKQNY